MFRLGFFYYVRCKKLHSGCLPKSSGILRDWKFGECLTFWKSNISGFKYYNFEEMCQIRSSLQIHNLIVSFMFVHFNSLKK